jgi:hypothetical protein
VLSCGDGAEKSSKEVHRIVADALLRRSTETKRYRTAGLAR